MWRHLIEFMRNKTAQVMEAAGDRVDSLISLLSSNWLRGQQPTSRNSLVWDFRCNENVSNCVLDNSSSIEKVFSNESSENGDSSDLSNNESTSFCETDSSSSSSLDFDDQEALDAKLMALYNKK